MNHPGNQWILIIALGFAISVLPAQAHHSIAGVYDTNQQVTIQGAVAEFQFINPHPYVTIGVRQDSGELQQWKLEMDNRSELVEAGMTKETLKPGDQVVVRGNPLKAKGKVKGRVLYIRKLERPADGFVYEQVGRSPVIHGGR